MRIIDVCFPGASSFHSKANWTGISKSRCAPGWLKHAGCKHRSDADAVEEGHLDALGQLVSVIGEREEYFRYERKRCVIMAT
jgi:hypothetical protein